MDNTNNNNITDSNQGNVNTNSVNTYNSIQPSSPLMDNTNVNGTKANDNVDTIVEDLSGTPSVAPSTSAEELPSQEPAIQTVQNDVQDASAVSIPEFNTNVVGGLSGTSFVAPNSTPNEEILSQEPISPSVQSDVPDASSVSGIEPNLVEDLSGVQPVTPSSTPAEELLSQEQVTQTVQSDIPDISAQPQMPSFGSIPVMGESVASSPISEQQSVQSPNSIDMSAPLSQPILNTLETSNTTEPSMPSFEPIAQQPQAELSANSSLQAPMESPSAPAFNEEEIINTFGSEKKEKKGGNTVVIILIVVILLLLLAIGYFAYKVFFV